MILNKKITIVIVTYNARQYLPDCLSSLAAQDYPKELVNIIVVDNHSTDSTVGYIRERYPLIKVIENRRNAGFAEANNQGWFLAEKKKADYLVLLNQDTIVAPNWLLRLVKTAESSKKIAMVQPKLMLYPEKDLINSFGNCLHYLSFGFTDQYRKKDDNRDTRPREITYASGAACLIKMSALKKTGLFDSRLFMYHEDADLGWKMRLAGFKVMIDPLAVVFHKYNFSKAKYKFYYMERNRLVVSLQNYKLATLIVFFPMFLFMEAGIIFFSIKNGWFKEKMRGYGWIFLHLPSILAHRLRIQFKIRKVKDREILKHFLGSIKFQEIDNPLLRYFANPIMEAYFWLAKKVIFW